MKMVFPGSSPLNIVLLITDTFRFDNLFARARRPIHTPCLDAFARERAVEVLGFYTGSFPTIPQRTDLITGRIGWPWYPWQPLPKSSSNAWPLMLRRQGYATQLLCDCPHLFNAGFQHPFMAAYQTRGQEGDCPFLHLNDPIVSTMSLTKTREGAPLSPLAKCLADQHRWTNRYPQCEEDTFCWRTSKLAVRWLEENYRFRPFFLWVDFFDPHEPWDPPEYLVRKYQPSYHGRPMIHPNYGLSADYSREELTNLWAHYAAEAELVDRAIGRIFQKIEDLQLWDSTVVVVLSDHGFSIGEHARVGKTNINRRDPRFWPLYPEVSHAPLLIAAPGLRPAQRPFLAQPADLLPTITELAHARVDLPEPLHGYSFVKALKGQTKSHRALAVCGQWINPPAEGVPPKWTVPFVTDGSWGYVPLGPTGDPEIFDLHEDPLGERNLFRRARPHARRLRNLLMDYMRDLQAPQPVTDFLATL